jgi:UDP-GlcNAc3NAcA epimerase
VPEETNRVVTDHLSTLHFCPTLTAVRNLSREGITKGVEHVGDVMYDVALAVSERAEASSSFRDSGLAHRGFVLATAHRAANTDDRASLKSIVDALSRMAERHPVVFPAHPRTRQALARHGLEASALRLVDPVGMIDMAWLERHAALIVTDSGGVQKEGYFHRTPCVTMRTETEWLETVSAGWNRLANPDDADAIVRAAEASLEGAEPRMEIPEYGDGHAADKVVASLSRFLADP